jgi:hypothetical protein
MHTSRSLRVSTSSGGATTSYVWFNLYATIPHYTRPKRICMLRQNATNKPSRKLPQIRDENGTSALDKSATHSSTHCPKSCTSRNKAVTTASAATRLANTTSTARRESQRQPQHWSTRALHLRSELSNFILAYSEPAVPRLYIEDILEEFHMFVNEKVAVEF